MLAGLEAHRLGFQDIELHDPADRVQASRLKHKSLRGERLAPFGRGCSMR
jgi:hypothetical protein